MSATVTAARRALALHPSCWLPLPQVTAPLSSRCFYSFGTGSRAETALPLLLPRAIRSSPLQRSAAVTFINASSNSNRSCSKANSFRVSGLTTSAVSRQARAEFKRAYASAATLGSISAEAEEATQQEAAATKAGAQSLSLTRPVVAYHLFALAFLVYAIVIVGGLTRLTESGLSITEWNPGFKGMWLPTTEEGWEQEWSKYRATPEFLV